MIDNKHTVSGFLINALVTPICHSSRAIPVSFRIRSQPDLASPCQIYSPAYDVAGDSKKNLNIDKICKAQITGTIQRLPFDHLLKSVTVGKSRTTNPDIFFESQIFNLMQNSSIIIFSWTAILIGFDGSNVRRLSLF